MPFWFALLLYAATTVLGQFFRPKTSVPKPASLADLDAPTADPNRCITKVYGTTILKAPNVVSVTDFSSAPIKSKVGTLQKIISFGLAKSQTIGYKYYCGLEMSLGYRVDALTKIIIGDKVAWTGEVTTDSEIFIDKPTLFGGDDPNSSGNGGISAYVNVHLGSPTATKDPYLLSQYGNYSAHRGVFYVVCEGQARLKGSGYLGNSTRIEAWQFVCRCIPNALPYGLTNYSNINTGDANPAEVLYDILRSAEYAIGMPAQYVDTASFVYAASLYYDDGLGFSAAWDTSKPCRDIINQILKLTDSVLYTDLQTGKLILKAARADYDVDDLDEYNDDDILSISAYTRGAWAETTNAVTIPFVNRSNDFIEDTALAFDLGNQRIQGATIAANIQYVGIANAGVASDIAQRDLKAMSTPLAKVTFQVNNKAYKTTIGTPFKFSTNRIKDHNGNPINGLVMRCTGVRVGTPKSPVIELEAVEDLFNSVRAIYAAPPTTAGTDPNTTPVASATAVLDELPFMLAADENPHLWILAKAPNAGSFTFDMFSSPDNVGYSPDDLNNLFTPTGLLNAAYSAVTAAIDNSHVLVIVGASGSNLDKLSAATAAEVGNGANLFLVIEGSKVEIMAFESLTIVSGNYQLNNVWRGLLDTTPQAFTSAARAWFFSYGDARGIINYLPGSTAYGKVLTRTVLGILDLSAAAALNKAMSTRAVRPYSPGNIRVNGTYNGTIPGTGDITLAWSHRDRTRQGTVLAQNAATVGLEGGAAYTLKIYNEAGTLLRTASGLTAESYIYTNVQEMADNGGILAGALTFVLYTTRDGVTSYQAQVRGSSRGASVPASPAYAASGTYTPPPAGAATSISGVPITGTPTGTNNTPIYNPTTGLITWQPGGGGVNITDIAGVVSGIASTIQVPNTQLSLISPGVYRITPLQGATGTAGSVWYTGASAPAGGLGVDGDFYLRSSNSDVYQKAAGSWSVVANIKGAVGSTGVSAFVDSVVNISTNPAGTFTQGTISTAGSRGRIMKVAFSQPARLRIYSKATNRTADFSRAATQLATPDDNILYEVVAYTGHLTFEHQAHYANNDTVIADTLYWTVEGTVAVSIDLTIQIEQV